MSKHPRLWRQCSSTRFLVQGNSMSPALHNGDAILVDTRAYRRSPPERGDVVLFEHREPGQAVLVYSVKRIVGLPGEHLLLQDGRVLVNGVPLPEPQAGATPTQAAHLPTQWFVAEGQCFLLGDNRADSLDSRRLGPVDAGDIVGRAWWRYWPPRRWGRVR
ncbi:MAG: signal peptidase I [Chloroflexi bacterium]|nr:signal peptidase I [Chloroflexota bacterium]